MIEFFAENVELPALDYERIKEWIREVAALHGYAVGSLTYCFCDDPYILATNRRFLSHDYFTDIITFDYTRHYSSPREEEREEEMEESPVSPSVSKFRECVRCPSTEGGEGEKGEEREMLGKIGGDMIISLDTVRSNAQGIGVPYKQELLRVIIHGILHLCGIDDKAPGAREIMESHENQALQLMLNLE